MTISSLVRDKMQVIDSMKTARIVGVLMQQAATLPSAQGSHVQYVVTHNRPKAVESTDKLPTKVEKALDDIKNVTLQFKKTYFTLTKANSMVVPEIIADINNVNSKLIEQQFRSLEGTVRIAYSKASGQRKILLKQILTTVAKARSATSDLNSLVSQMTERVEVFKSSIDKEALIELAKHGSEVFSSGKFH